MARQRTIIEVLENNEHNQTLLNYTRNINTFLYDNRDKEPTNNHYLQARDFMSANAGFELSMQQVQGMLALYPHARIKLAAYNGIADTEVRDLLLNVLSNFFLGCDWPNYGDKVDLKIFLAALRKQAIAMDFTI
jgi:hypothetical protein